MSYGILHTFLRVGGEFEKRADRIERGSVVALAVKRSIILVRRCASRLSLF